MRWRKWLVIQGAVIVMIFGIILILGDNVPVVGRLAGVCAWVFGCWGLAESCKK